nr:FAD-dependent oxidoreductase [Acuticoccus mangrovi]
MSPVTVGPRTLRNRVWMLAHATLLVKDHLFTDSHVAYYVERAKGGVAAITMEAMAVHPTTQPYKGKAFAFDERMVEQYRKIAGPVQAEGSLLLMQPWHRGRQTNSVANGLPVWSPSAIPCAVYREMPHVMTAKDIDDIVKGYRLSARYAKEGGLDGVEVAGLAHGYLIQQFLSPAINNRTDAFGGSVENRLRIVEEILAATREEVGADMIVGIRMNGDDGHEGGLRPDDWADIAARLEATGMVDYFSVSQGTYINRMLIYPTSPEIHGFQLPATAKIADAVTVPVIGGGRIVTHAEAEGFLAEGKCEIVGLARQLIADPAWVRKAETAAEPIRPCVGANWCMSSIFAQAPIACIHNPAAGAETELSDTLLEVADVPRRVAVVGGGPAGLRAALTAARRGHEVTLFEARSRLGGQVRLWAEADSRRELVEIVDWMIDRLAETSATVRLDTRIGAAELREMGFDAVVVASGAVGLKHGWTPLRPGRWIDGSAVPGADQPHVYSYIELLETRPRLPDSVVVFDALGGRQGAVVAEYCSRVGAAVTFATQLGQASPDLAASRDWGKVHKMLRTLGVRFVPDVELAAIGATTATLRDVYTGEATDVPAGAVVMMVGAAAADEVFHALDADRGSLSLHLVGDAMSPRRVNDAIREAEIAARAI